MNFSNFLCAYRKLFIPACLIRFIEEWKTSLEAKKHTAAVLMDLSTGNKAPFQKAEGRAAWELTVGRRAI